MLKSSFLKEKQIFVVYSRLTLELKNLPLKKKQKDHEDRILILDVCSINDSKYILINLYNASTEKEQTEALSNLFALLTTIDIINLNKHFIMAGDFNLFLTRYLMQRVDTLH